MVWGVVWCGVVGVVCGVVWCVGVWCGVLVCGVVMCGVVTLFLPFEIYMVTYLLT